MYLITENLAKTTATSGWVFFITSFYLISKLFNFTHLSYLLHVRHTVDEEHFPRTQSGFQFWSVSLFSLTHLFLQWPEIDDGSKT